VVLYYFILIVVVIFLLILLPRLLGKRRHGQYESPFAGTSPERVESLKSQLLRRDELLDLLRRNQKIAAIKLLREDTGAGLREAKETVESITGDYIREGILPLPDNTYGRYPGAAPSSSSVPRDIPPIDGELEAEIRELLIRKQKIAAIRLYRDKTGAGLREAKDIVESVEARMQART